MRELLLMCRIGGHRAAFPALDVQSVIEIEAVTPIPRTPGHVVGLAALRSQALTVIDCRASLGLAASRVEPGSRAAVIRFEGHTYALLVDDAYDVDEAQTDPRAVPGGFGDAWQRAAVGMVETAAGPTLLLSVERLIAGPEALAA